MYKMFSLVAKGPEAQSDLLKNLQRERKTLTNLADYSGGVLVFLLTAFLRNYFSVDSRYVYFAMCLFASVLNLYSYSLTKDVEIKDPLMTDEQYDLFLRQEFFNLGSLFKMSKKDQFFMLRVFLLKVALGLSKSYFLNRAMLCLDFNVTTLNLTNVMLQTYSFLIDYVQASYRRRYGKQMLSSFSSMSLSGGLILVSGVMLRLGIQSSSASMILAAYAPSLIAASLLVSSLNHLFEI